MKRLTMLLLLAACTSTSPSGFLTRFSDLKPQPDAAGQLAWFRPGLDLRDYDSLMIDPIGVRLHPDAAAGALGASTLRRAAEDFRRILIETVDPYYTVVTEDRPHVLRVRVALTDIVASRGAIGVDGAAMEAELLDPETSVRLAAALDRIRGAKKPASAYRMWAERLLDFMDSRRE